MKKSLAIAIVITAVVLAAASLSGMAGAQEPSVSRGGQLYDEWWDVIGADAPSSDLPLWTTQSTNTRTGSITWRCKECHGWDYLGVDGAYGSGSHRTGFPGVYDAAQSKTADQLAAALRGSTNPDHDFASALDARSIADLAAFMKNGLIDPRQYIDYATKTAKTADTKKGQKLFDGLCATCHGANGALLNFGDEDEPEYVGTIAVDNPQEFLHKVRFGQPGSRPTMPAVYDLGWPIQDVLNVMAYSQGLPANADDLAAAPAAQASRTSVVWWLLGAVLAVVALALAVLLVARARAPRPRQPQPAGRPAPLGKGDKEQVMKQKPIRIAIAIALVGAAVFGVLQFFRPGLIGNNPPVTRPAVWPSAEAEDLARRACYECHSNESDYPWYAYIMPVSLLLADHIERGRAMMNFSEWEPGMMPPQIFEYAIRTGRMPSSDYLLTHPEARLTPQEKEALIQAFKEVR